MSRRLVSWTFLTALSATVVGVGLREVGAQQARRPTLAERLSALRQSVMGETETSGQAQPAERQRPQTQNQRPQRAPSPASPMRNARRSPGNAQPTQQPARRSWRGAMGTQPDAARKSSTPSATDRSGRSLLDSFDALLPFRDSASDTAAQRPPQRRPQEAAPNPRRAGRQIKSNSPARESPPNRPAESTDGLLDLTSQPPELPEVVAGQAPEDLPPDVPAPKALAIERAGSVSTEQLRSNVVPDRPASSRRRRTSPRTDAETDPPEGTAADQRGSNKTPAVEVITPSDSSEDVAEVDDITPIRRSPLVIKTTPPVDSPPEKIEDRTPVAVTVPDSEMSTPAKESWPNSRSTTSRAPVLIAQSAPAISTQVTGPREVILGREALYQVALRNEGTVAAEAIVAEVRLPTTAEVMSSDATVGFAQREGDGTLAWRLQSLAAGTTARLDIQLIPRSAESLELGVVMRTEPVAQQTVVTVQEPRLAISLDGPDDVLYGQPQVYRLRVANPGTGPAEGVVLYLQPPGASDAERDSHEIGLLPAGKTETYDVELVAHDAGELRVIAAASAEGGLSADCEKAVRVRRPRLTIDAEGPAESYAGTVATYYFRVRNDGTADAPGVSVTVQLPQGAKLALDGDRQRPVVADNSVTWDVGSLRAGDEQIVEMRCVVTEPGKNDIVTLAQTADGNLQVRTVQSTVVVALADLKLEVSDPTGPVAAGAEAVYEIRIRNRGTNTAREIQVVALFSEGIDPVAVEGGQHNIYNGRVAFRPIESLAPGRVATLRIRAVANQAGTHVFRAEVLCSELETKLAMEETTRYFATDGGQGRTMTATHPDTSSRR